MTDNNHTGQGPLDGDELPQPVVKRPRVNASLIWLVPIVLGAGALVAVGALFWRRTRQFEQLRADQPAENQS